MAKKKIEELQEENVNSRLEATNFKELLKAIEKDIGSNLIIKASDEKINSFPMIPTGIFQLDCALGGGVPVSQITEFYGPFSSMKTSLVLKIIANAQKLCANCWIHADLHNSENTKACEKFVKVTTVFLDVEKHFNGKWAAKLGVNCDDVVVIQPPYAEKAIDIADQILRSGNVDILVLDSLAALVPMKEIEKSSEDQIIGTQAKLIGTMCRKTLAAMLDVQKEKGRAPTVFWTNQTREKITMFGLPEVQSGGQAFQFFITSMIRLEKGKPVYASEKDKEDVPLYIPFKFSVKKNKMGVPLMEGEFRLITTETEEKKVGDIYDENKIMDFAEQKGFYKQAGDGSKMWYFDGEPIGNAKSTFERKLLIDPEFSTKVRNFLLDKFLKR